ncbi:hypothetical protein RX21_04483 [Escherichia coli]|nr:hypothetical protein RX21_04483 [Escherichia coli]OYB95874.1 hypothetical protein RX19_04033 [Escherichia coli]
MEIKLIDNPVKLAEFLNNPANTGNIVDSGDKYYIKPDAVTNGAIVIHTQRLKSDPGGNLLS